MIPSFASSKSVPKSILVCIEHRKKIRVENAMLNLLAVVLKRYDLPRSRQRDSGVSRPPVRLYLAGYNRFSVVHRVGGVSHISFWWHIYTTHRT